MVSATNEALVNDPELSEFKYGVDLRLGYCAGGSGEGVYYFFLS